LGVPRIFEQIFGGTVFPPPRLRKTNLAGDLVTAATAGWPGLPCAICTLTILVLKR
jgi:hypothetical protein